MPDIALRDRQIGKVPLPLSLPIPGLQQGTSLKRLRPASEARMEPTGRANARPMKRFKQSIAPQAESWIAHMGMGCVNKRVSLFLRSKVRAGFDDLVCLPDQTHIRSSREATAPGFRLRREGSRGRDHSSLRHLKPSNPSVHPPGSAEADRAWADWFCWLFSGSRRVPE